MKKSLFYLFMLMAVAAMPLTSCEKDPQKEEEGQHNAKADDDQTEITAYNSLSWLQGAIVIVNKNGEVVRRVYGEPLDESQPDVLSAPVSSYAAAEKIFLSWVAPGKTATKVDGGYDYNLTDHEGKAQGSVSFRAVEGEGRVIARMTVAEGTDLKEVSQFDFVNSKQWPENSAYEKVEAGKIYEMDGHVLTWTWGLFNNTFNEPKATKLPFYCIQGNTDGKEGILVWISPDSNDDGDILYHPRCAYYTGDAFKYLPTVPQGEKVLEFYNNNQTFWNNMLKEMDAKGYMWSPQDGEDATGCSEFLLQQIMPYMWPASGVACLDFDEPKGKLAGAVTTTYYMYRYMHIKTIPAVE